MSFPQASRFSIKSQIVCGLGNFFFSHTCAQAINIVTLGSGTGYGGFFLGPFTGPINGSAGSAGSPENLPPALPPGAAYAPGPNKADAPVAAAAPAPGTPSRWSLNPIPSVCFYFQLSMLNAVPPL
jgi:hypothetical protein